ncbi:MAG: helix-turn-helix transcriptional regulator [Candidatus Nanoarchaeia archaeon]|nr:helix-turn-helix transcriptional regulator [Candidatus Nanoarchaeia archaeon]
MEFRWRIGFGKELGAEIKRLISELDLSQNQVARTINYNKGQFSRILNGEGFLDGSAYLSLYRFLLGKYKGKSLKEGATDPVFMRDYIPQILLKE